MVAADVRHVAPPPRPVASQAERAAYLKWMDGRCFRCLGRKHFAAACTKPLKCWRCYKDFHLASQCFGSSPKPSSSAPSSGPRPGVDVDRGVPAGHASRPRSYADALLALPLGDRSARPTDGCALPRAPVEQDAPFLARSTQSWGEQIGFNVECMMGGFDEPAVLVESQVEVSSVAAKVTQVDAPPLSLEEFLSKVTREVPPPLLGTPKPLRKEKDDASRPERRSGRLEKKNMACSIPTSKRAEHRLLEIFDELPEVRKVEGAEQKMKAYLDMYKKPLSPQVIAALSTLVGIAGKSKLDLTGCFPQDNDSP